ncbi:MAG TPA: GcrA family cell cycle regulator [Stellaceae bacterium]
MPRKNWTPERDRYVDRRIGEGATYAAIAGELGAGFTASAIAGRMHRRAGRELIQSIPYDQAAARRALQRLEQSLGYERATQGGCRWVIGDPPGAWHWCGQPLAEGSWCAEHAAAARNPRGETKR